jgi:hypothetical protein
MGISSMTAAVRKDFLKKLPNCHVCGAALTLEILGTGMTESSWPPRFALIDDDRRFRLNCWLSVAKKNGEPHQGSPPSC